jgi:hypothetical protein
MNHISTARIRNKLTKASIYIVDGHTITTVRSCSTVEGDRDTNEFLKSTPPPQAWNSNLLLHWACKSSSNRSKRDGIMVLRNVLWSTNIKIIVFWI